MVQSAFGASCMNRASAFEWHKRFKEARESVRDDERCGRSKEVKTPELIDQLKTWKICKKFVPRVLREDQKERHCHESREMVELINSDPVVLDALVACDESWIYCYDPETKRQNSQRKKARVPRLKKARQSKSTHKHLMIPFLTALTWSTCTGFPLDRKSTRNTMLRF